jgi:hypothetical protein
MKPSNEQPIGTPKFRTTIAARRQETAAGRMVTSEQEGAPISEADRTRRALEEELSTVKRKYRAAQYDVQRERKSHGATKARLAAMENRLAIYESSRLWALYLTLVRFWKRMGGVAGKLGGASRKRQRQVLQTISASGLFDAKWYLREYPDVAAAGLDPLVHYSENGWREGRDPGPQFASSAYLKSNADVARCGINPLLHYIEHGRSEGRAVRAPSVSAAPIPAIAHDFPAAAPVYRPEVYRLAPTPWVRAYRLSADEPTALLEGGHIIGLVADADIRRRIQSAFQRLASFSGFAPIGPAVGAHAEQDHPAELVDCWYVNETQLRSRWRQDESPFVLRGYQCDPSDGSLALVAESLVEAETDLVETSLIDPWFPVLFVFGRPDGSVTGSRLMAFPSLCRGGLHYVELLALSPEQPDPLAVGTEQAARMERAKQSATRLVRSISVDVEGADGTSPLFNPQFRRWLDKVAGLSVSPAEGAIGAAADLLGSCAAVQRTGGGSLAISGDMVPSISFLSLTEGEGEPDDSPIFLPVVIAGAESSQPATFVELPKSAPAALAARASGYPAVWPRYVPDRPVRLPVMSDPAAVRVPSGRIIADAELLTPAMGQALLLAEKISSGLTWIVFPQEWRSEDLARSIQGLSLQIGAGNHKLAFVGAVDDGLQALARGLFGDNAALFTDAESAAAALKTPFAGYIGPGVILHDNRCASFLMALLDDPEIASAACALVIAERRGKNWHVSMADAGRMAKSRGTAAVEAGAVPEIFWRSVFPVSQPPRDLWIARSRQVKKWLGNRSPQRLAKGAHVCTTLVTASYLGARGDDAPEVRVPPATEEAALRATVLFG